ncbi:PhoH family protein [Sporosalibacterium faouarense]|uniref:PhoH family protein n=1 Tax=Sporosalibacterium faouarense TaxID=516123 RepID=UPI00141CEBEB|nr:PhoH family protein [Sporosalibacterium faouarense]MTI47489.1 PhoH family protein [Bacillota bacterium]
MKKVFVLDTSVLLEDPSSLFSFDDNEVIIPVVVLEEIDHKKRLGDDIGRNARHVSRILDNLREKGSHLQKGITLENGGTLRVELNHKHFDEVGEYFNERSNDNRILAVALNLLKEEENIKSDKQIILVSRDVLVRVKANALGIDSQDYLSGRIISNQDMYYGFESVKISPSLIDKFYAEGFLDISSKPFNKYLTNPHQFFILKDIFGSSKSAIGKYNSNSDRLEQLHLGEQDVWGIRARNAQQKMALELLLDDSIPLVTITGRAGTGKTLLALASGLYKTEELNRYKKLLVARPIVPMGKDLGFLPGDKDEKLRPWIQPIYDNLEYIFGTRRNRDIEDIVVGMKKLEVEALTFIRGRTIPNQFIIIDEAQNLTKHEVKTIVSRVGENSKIVLVGDPEQIDHPYLDSSSNGLVYIVEKFKEYNEGAHINLIKGERSTLAQLAADIL